MTPDDARRLALSLPEAVEADHHGRPSFRVGGKIFATLWDDEHMNVMLDVSGIEAAAAQWPDACTPFRWGSRIGALHVSLADVDADGLRELLLDAWRRKAPKRLLAE